MKILFFTWDVNLLVVAYAENLIKNDLPIDKEKLKTVLLACENLGKHEISAILFEKALQNGVLPTEE